jgi:WD40 repeat protein
MKNLIISTIYLILIIIKLALTYTEIYHLNVAIASEVFGLKVINKEFVATCLWRVANIGIWDLKNNKIEAIITSHTTTVTSLELLNDGTLVSCSEDLTIKLWNITTRKEIKTLKGTHTETGQSPFRCVVSKTLTNEIIATGSEHASIRLWNITTGLRIKELSKTTNETAKGVHSLLLLNDGRLAAGEKDTKIRLWNITDNSSLDLNSNCVVECLLQLNDEKLASGCEKRSEIKIWNITNGNLIKILESSEKGFMSFVLLTNEIFASGSIDGELIFWNISTGYINSKKKIHDHIVWSLVKLKDGEFVSGSNDKKAILWNYKVYPNSLINYWPMSSLNDSIGGATLFGGSNYSFVEDRFGTPNSAIYFNNGYLQIPSGVYFSDDFTITAWIYLKSCTHLAKIIYFGNGVSNDNVIFGINDNTSTLIGEIFQNNNKNKLESDLKLDLNQWHFVSFVLIDTKAYIYVNGEQIANGKLHIPINILRKSNFIGKSNLNSSENINAIFDEIKIYKGALSKEEIKLSYDSALNPTTSITITPSTTLITSTATSTAPNTVSIFPTTISIAPIYTSNTSPTDSITSFLLLIQLHLFIYFY